MGGRGRETREGCTQGMYLGYHRCVRVALERGVHMGKRERLLFALAFGAILAVL